MSSATDRAHFDVAAPDGSPMVDFGTLKVGESITRRLTLTVRGIDPLLFLEGAVVIRDSAGNPAPGIRIVGSSFGTTGVSYLPGQTATLDIAFSPTSSGALSGTVRISGQVNNGNPETPSLFVVTPFSGTATAVVGGRGGSGSRSALADTGAGIARASGFGILTLLAGVVAVAVVRRARRS